MNKKQKPKTRPTFKSGNDWVKTRGGGVGSVESRGGPKGKIS